MLTLVILRLHAQRFRKICSTSLNSFHNIRRPHTVRQTIMLQWAQT